MATTNVPETGNEQACGNAGKVRPDAVKSLHDLDAIVQDATESISALAIAARRMLTLNANDLMTVSELLNQIQSVAMDIGDHVNSEAEKFGANYIDTDRRELIDRLFTQRRTLHGTTDAGAIAQ